jgi:hypothetical protein
MENSFKSSNWGIFGRIVSYWNFGGFLGGCLGVIHKWCHGFRARGEGSAFCDALLNFWEVSKEKSWHRMEGGGWLKKSIFTVTSFVNGPLGWSMKKPKYSVENHSLQTLKTSPQKIVKSHSFFIKYHFKIIYSRHDEKLQFVHLNINN